MCDFKPGDEVVRFQDLGLPALADDDIGVPPVGHVGRISDVGFSTSEEEAWIDLDNWPRHPKYGLRADEFRKVQRRDLSAWLATSNTIEGPVRAPAKERA